jgi:hypothetical protein
MSTGPKTDSQDEIAIVEPSTSGERSAESSSYQKYLQGLCDFNPVFSELNDLLYLASPLDGSQETTIALMADAQRGRWRINRSPEAQHLKQTKDVTNRIIVLESATTFGLDQKKVELLASYYDINPLYLRNALQMKLHSIFEYRSPSTYLTDIYSLNMYEVVEGNAFISALLVKDRHSGVPTGIESYLAPLE